MSPTLAGLAEVADLLGVHKNTALAYTRRDDFPTPLDRLATGPVWKRADVEVWAAKTLPIRRGRPVGT
jgi:hypothetical protein